MAVDEITFTQARATLADLVGRAEYAGARVVLTRHGRRVAALVPIADLERLEAMEGREDQVIPLRHGQYEPHGTVPPAPSQRLDVAARHDGGPTLIS